MQTIYLYFYCYRIIVFIAVHMSVLQLIATAIGYLTPDRLSSSVLTTIAVLVSGVVSGVPLNFADLKKIPGIRALSTLSPTRYLILPLLQNDHTHETLVTLASSLVCRNKQVGGSRRVLVAQRPMLT